MEGSASLGGHVNLDAMQNNTSKKIIEVISKIPGGQLLIDLPRYWNQGSFIRPTDAASFSLAVITGAFYISLGCSSVKFAAAPPYAVVPAAAACMCTLLFCIENFKYTFLVDGPFITTRDIKSIFALGGSFLIFHLWLSGILRDYLIEILLLCTICGLVAGFSSNRRKTSPQAVEESKSPLAVVSAASEPETVLAVSNDAEFKPESRNRPTSDASLQGKLPKTLTPENFAKIEEELEDARKTSSGLRSELKITQEKAEIELQKHAHNRAVMVEITSDRTKLEKQVKEERQMIAQSQDAFRDMYIRHSDLSVQLVTIRAEAANLQKIALQEQNSLKQALAVQIAAKHVLTTQVKDIETAIMAISQRNEELILKTAFLEHSLEQKAHIANAYVRRIDGDAREIALLTSKVRVHAKDNEYLATKRTAAEMALKTSNETVELLAAKCRDAEMLLCVRASVIDDLEAKVRELEVVHQKAERKQATLVDVRQSQESETSDDQEEAVTVSGDAGEAYEVFERSSDEWSRTSDIDSTSIDSDEGEEEEEEEEEEEDAATPPRSNPEWVGAVYGAPREWDHVYDSDSTLVDSDSDWEEDADEDEEDDQPVDNFDVMEGDELAECHEEDDDFVVVEPEVQQIENIDNQGGHCE